MSLGNPCLWEVVTIISILGQTESFGWTFCAGISLYARLHGHTSFRIRAPRIRGRIEQMCRAHEIVQISEVCLTHDASQCALLFGVCFFYSLRASFILNRLCRGWLSRPSNENEHSSDETISQLFFRFRLEFLVFSWLVLVAFSVRWYT